MEDSIHLVVVVHMVAAEEVSKKSLRNYALSLRKELINKKDLETKIINNVLNNKKVLEANNILIYVSLDMEVDTKELINKLWKLNKNIYVPKVEENIINFYKINSFGNLVIGSFGVLEPITNIIYKDDNNSCCIIPGLLFDKNNNRLGYGKGYYDKFLENRNIYKIGICFSKFLVDSLVTDKYDIKMDEVITER